MINCKPNVGAALLAVWCGVLCGTVQAQAPIYRCGNEYTNNPGDAKARGCRLVEGGNLTIVEGAKPAGVSKPAAPRANAGNPVRSGADTAEQRARDNDARAILEAELRKAETRVQELQAEYAGGEPAKQGTEFRNPALYQTRVAEIKAKLDRAESDVAAIKRELGRSDGATR